MFRVQALVHQGEPEELDLVPRLVNPQAWLMAVLLLAAITAALIWAFLGGLPRTVSAQGLLTPPTGLSVVQSPYGGVVKSMLVGPNHPVTTGQRIAAVLGPTGTTQFVTSPFTGQVISLAAVAGQAIQPGAALVDVQRPSGNGMEALLFVSAKQAASIGPGMSVDMSVDAAPSSAFGLLRGRVRSISPYPVTPQQAQALLGNPILADRFVGSGAVQLVSVTLTRADTRSGYAWTSPHGPPFPLLPQSLLQGTVRIGSQHPIDVVFGTGQ